MLPVLHAGIHVYAISELNINMDVWDSRAVQATLVISWAYVPCGTYTAQLLYREPTWLVECTEHVIIHMYLWLDIISN